MWRIVFEQETGHNLLQIARVNYFIDNPKIRIINFVADRNMRYSAKTCNTKASNQFFLIGLKYHIQTSMIPFSISMTFHYQIFIDNSEESCVN